MEHFFEVLICAQMHTRVKLLVGMQMKTILKLFGGIQSYSHIIGGSPPPLFRHHWLMQFGKVYLEMYKSKSFKTRNTKLL